MLENIITSKTFKKIQDTFQKMFDQSRVFDYEGDLFLGVNFDVEVEMCFELNTTWKMLGSLDNAIFDSWHDGDSINLEEMSEDEVRRLLLDLTDERKYKQATFALTDQEEITIFVEKEKIPENARILKCIKDKYGCLAFE